MEQLTALTYTATNQSHTTDLHPLSIVNPKHPLPQVCVLCKAHHQQCQQPSLLWRLAVGRTDQRCPSLGTISASGFLGIGLLV
ncbi:hypothetical protein [Nostoc sp.]|uniref:hypothetical protein n=1 Tax=Nostoc sp. TaxID=1180 RepID=UPI002FF756C6